MKHLLVWILLGGAISASAQNWQMTGFIKADSQNPILSPSLQARFQDPITNKMVGWENKNVLNPTALVRDGLVHLLYRAQDSLGTSRIGLATSEDGIHFKKNPEPILFPSNDAFRGFEWPGGIEDPRIVETEDGGYFLTYTSYDGKFARLCGAFSKDLKVWEKIGPLFTSEKYLNTWSKSGAIVSVQNGTKIVAKKINGLYYMYFGDTDLFLATSKDLRQWDILENAENATRLSVLKPRAGYFDSRLVEPGPYALLRKEGIVLIYNSMNALNYNETRFPKSTYSAGQVLFDAQKPYKVIARTNEPFIWPNQPYEKVGEVNDVCFVEGLVPYKGKWFLYYGTADSKIAVSIKK
jgi:predicted GH43/DUF377 family glycosyl hydrolase